MANVNAGGAIGTLPAGNNDVNLAIGGLCRQFLLFKDSVHRAQKTFAALDLTLAPYTFDATGNSNLKSALNGLDTAMQAVDTTFIDRVAGASS